MQHMIRPAVTNDLPWSTPPFMPQHHSKCSASYPTQRCSLLTPSLLAATHLRPQRLFKGSNVLQGAHEWSDEGPCDNRGNSSTAVQVQGVMGILLVLLLLVLAAMNMPLTGGH